MKRAVVIVMLLCALPAFGQNTQTLSGGVQEIAKQIAAGLATKDRQRVGITAFTDVHTRATNVFGSYLAESITTRLVVAGLDVVERLQMEKVIAQLNVEASRVVDPATAKRVGKQAGVEAIVVGTMADMGSEIEINVRVIDIAVGRVLAVAVTRITRDTMVSTMLGGPAPSVGKKTDLPKPLPKPAEEEDGAMAWTVAGTRIVIDNTERNSNSVVLALAFENNSDEERTVRARTYSLLDENGDRYRFDHDSQRFVSEGVTIAPRTRARSNFWFRCKGDCNGTKFTLLDPSNKVILRDILVARR
jgi:TolB-like protein